MAQVRKLILAIAAAVLAGPLPAQDLAFKAAPELYLPLGADAALFKAGLGAEFRADAELFGFLSPSLEAGLAARACRQRDFEAREIVAVRDFHGRRL